MGQDAINRALEQDNTDNSLSTDNQEPSDFSNEGGDNSQGNLDQEPENNANNDKQTESTNSAASKFKTFEDAVNGYNALEKKFGQQSSEIGELRQKAKLADELQKQIDDKALQTAKENGFDTVQEFENHQEVTNYEADEYAKHLDDCEFPEEMVRMLAEYRKNPTTELRNAIEAEFSTDTLKQVAGNVAILKGQLQQKQNEVLETQIYTSAKKYLDVNVNKYSEEFKNPAFAALYGEAFRAYGCDLDTDKFVNLMHSYATSVIKAAGIKQGIELENSDATDEIAGLTNTNTLQKGQEKNILDMSEEEVRRELRKY